MVTSTGSPIWTWVRSVSFMFASIQTSFVETSATALVVVKEERAEMTSVPGCSESTAVAMPLNGARTTV